MNEDLIGMIEIIREYESTILELKLENARMQDKLTLIRDRAADVLAKATLYTYDKHLYYSDDNLINNLINTISSHMIDVRIQELKEEREKEKEEREKELKEEKEGKESD